MPSFSFLAVRQVISILFAAGLLVLIASCPPESHGTPTPTVTGTPRMIFVTSQTFNGNIRDTVGAPSGLQAVDQACNDAAATAGLSGTYLAWVSDSDFDAWTRLDYSGGDGPWYLTDGVTPVFAVRASVLSPPLVSIHLDENGNEVAPGQLVWTGTHADGTSALDNCVNWTDDTSDVMAVHPVSGRVGSATAGGMEWTDALSNTCADMLPLYCLEILSN